MMKKLVAFSGIAILLLAVAVMAGCSGNSGKYSPEMQAKVDSMQKVLKAMNSESDTIAKYLMKFDTLDFVVFSKQQWLRFHESHGKDIVVNWPDGHHTNGLEKHIEDMKAMFVYAPNTSIKVHPIKFGKGEWTCVTGIMTGTFTNPMPVEGGKYIQPTGKSFSIPMCTVGHWKDGVMIEESLFWDNQTYMTQMGLGK